MGRAANASLNNAFCHFNADDCTEGTCLNGGTCVDGVRDFECVCLEDFTGRNCESQFGKSIMIIIRSFIIMQYFLQSIYINKLMI